ncbi:hypothetical protein BJ170DRAFT_175778 [Xylariales sp. AK1849]|nr:hypothetical protein BJ170DRAFT_175778 [Xylariales sp. AK1849]
MGSRKLDRASLEKNKIFFFEEKGAYGQVPDHVNSLRDALLDSACTVSTRLSFYDEDEYEDPELLRSVLSKLYMRAPERDSIEQSILTYKDMKKNAKDLDYGQDREAEWVSFYDENFLTKLRKEFEITDKDSRRVARAKFYYDGFDIAKGRRWTVFQASRDFRKKYGKGKLTMPTPDWVAYFRVYDLESSWTRIPNSSGRWPFANSVKESIVENFSLPVLQGLAEHSLQFSVANNLRQHQSSPVVLSDLLCYPWLITEHKKKEKRKDIECFCQAANAGAASLMLLQTLVKHSTCKTVLPVVTMTTWGPEVRIWICFFDGSLDEYNMICIWEGDMKRIVHIVELQAILENTHTWAMRVLRPWISHHIDQWKSACHIGRGWEQEENVRNNSTGRSGALSLTKFLPDFLDKLQDEISDDEMEHSELRELLKKQHLLLLTEIRELLGTLGANTNTLQSKVRPPQTRSVLKQTYDDPSIRPEENADDIIPGYHRTCTPERKSDSASSDRLSRESSVLCDISRAPRQSSHLEQMDSRSATSPMFEQVFADNKRPGMQREQKEQKQSFPSRTNVISARNSFGSTTPDRVLAADNQPYTPNVSSPAWTEGAQQVLKEFENTESVFDPVPKDLFSRRPTPGGTPPILRFNLRSVHDILDISKDGKCSGKTDKSDPSLGHVTQGLGPDSSDLVKTTSRQTSPGSGGRHGFTYQTESGIDTPSKTSANTRSAGSDSCLRVNQPLLSDSSSRILQDGQSPSSETPFDLPSQQQSNVTFPSTTLDSPPQSNPIGGEKLFPCLDGAQVPSSSTPSVVRLPDLDAETDSLYSVRDLFRLPQIDSPETWSSSGAKSPVSRLSRDWKKFDRPLPIVVTRHTVGLVSRFLSDGYPYLTFVKGQLFDVWEIRDNRYLAQKRIGKEHPKGWIWDFDVYYGPSETYRPLKTTARSQHHYSDYSDPPNDFTEGNQIEEMNESSINLLKAAGSSAAFQQSQATASLAAESADQRDLGSASMLKDDFRIMSKYVRNEKTGRRIRIRLPIQSAMQCRVSPEVSVHRHVATSVLFGAALNSLTQEDGPPDLVSSSEKPSTLAANHSGETNFSATQSRKVDLFEQFKNGHFKGGLFEGLGSIGWKPRLGTVGNSDTREGQESRVVHENKLYPGKDEVRAQESLRRNGSTEQDPESCVSAQKDWETTDEE